MEVLFNICLTSFMIFIGSLISACIVDASTKYAIPTWWMKIIEFSLMATIFLWFIYGLIRIWM